MSWFALYLFLFLRYSAKQLQHTFLYAFLHSQNPSDCQLKEYPSDFQSQNIRSSGEDKQFWVQVLLLQIKKKKKKAWIGEVEASYYQQSRVFIYNPGWFILLFNYFHHEFHLMFLVRFLSATMIPSISILHSALQRN